MSQSAIDPLGGARLSDEGVAIGTATPITATVRDSRKGRDPEHTVWS
jgi:hypothetical protein